MRNQVGVCLAVVLAAFTGGAHATAVAGRFQFTAGDVRLLKADGTQHAARKGQAVDEGETVVTGPNSSAQLLMVDDAIIALRPNSRLNISVYRYAEPGKQAVHAGRGVLDLIQGGFRAITGAIGHVNKDDYLVHTENATIGIRGTDHEPMYIGPSVAGEAPLGNPGTYDKVNTGGTYVENGNGRVDVSPNEVGFAGLTPGAKPMLLKGVPAFMLPTPPVRKGQNGAGEAAEDATDLGSFLPAWSETVVQRDDITPSSATPAPLIDYAAVVGDLGNTGAHSAAAVVTEKESDNFFSATINSALVSPASVDNYKYNNGRQLAAASATLPGTTVPVNWGIYSGGQVQDGPGAPRKVDYFVAMTGPETPRAVVATLSGTYSNVAASAMVTESGMTGGTMNSANIVLANGNLTGYSIGLSDGASRSWAASCSSCGGAGVPLADFKSAGVALRVTGPTAGPATGQAHGMPIGPAGQGVLSSFSLQSGSSAVIGTFAATK